ncbi:chromosome segregation protein SMC [Aquibacillus salsiterrae]|uniref:Chromosome partition protein Smc n=1 Tax=Aquibacillus salsiterrae TaxID=2950439 RepID=A0A9X4AED7_9BACI|nr:chromosome segregation protein SMC [Aquibacillus salsiterrae]MDC3416424.1 chromosome segregation protein SMC [Aquibacillus salsiterrae]
MFLKRLDTVGFKSFAERISVDFVTGVTAVVGPNGSGKSNITDAIRWVLGEQSAKSLRGSKMEDIIFQGSDSRNPLNVAEVTLTLDNSDQRLPVDYAEVSVTRRVFRSGESEFLINNQSCRLKDIIDLFMDSGLGREAFSIISQGKVEEILSSKAEERRTIFEEAAGVLKYKHRKQKAEYKLAETQENLNRVEDIIYEIESQLEPLKEQASVAKEYLLKKDQLKEQEISLLVSEIELLHAEWKQLLEEIELEKNKELQLKTSIQNKEANLERERTEIQTLDQTIESLQETLLTLTKELEGLEGNKKLINERFKHFEENKHKLEMEVDTLSGKITETESKYQQEKEKLTSLAQKRKETRQELDQLAKTLSTTKENIVDQIEELKSDYIEKLNEQAAMRNEGQSIERQLFQMQQKKLNQGDKFQDLITEREKLEGALLSLKDELEQKHRDRLTADEHLQRLKVEIENDKQVYTDLQSKLYQGYQFIEKLKSKKEMLEEMKEDFQGFFQGVKEILKARDVNELKGISGAVIELLDVPSDYITAIETALGGQAQHIVVKDEAVARQAISWLKRTNKGRATFLPLSVMRAKSIPDRLLRAVRNDAGFVGVASDLVSFDQSYHPVITNLLGNVVITKTLKDANAIAVPLERRYRIVTLDGDVVNPGGSMSGGAQKKTNQSLFTRERDLQEVSTKLADYEQKAITFEQKVKEHKDTLEKKESQLEILREDINKQVELEQQVKSNVMEREVTLAHLNDSLKRYDQDKLQYDEDLSSLKARDKELAEQLESIKTELEHVQGEIDTLTNQEDKFQQNKKQLQDSYHQYQLLLTEQDNTLKNQKEKTTVLRDTLEELTASLNKNQEQLKAMVEFYQNHETEEEIEALLQSKKKEKELTTQSIQAKRLDRSNRTQRAHDKERELKQENRIHQSMTQQVKDKEVKSTRLDVELENRLNHLQSEYMMTFERASQEFERADDISKAKQAVKLIKRSIDDLGTVNLGAIDEFERIQERYHFLTEQQTDLLQAKDTLYGVISEMDEEMKRRFESTFTQIKNEFSEVFQALFGGGKAELKLTDPKNMLATGVEIVAQPPGKKLQHLGLLSGGERALTAIALLFAILRIRPVPFCILDEVEAALDEANVSRFARYLKDYSEKTQFIVITHRKGTMEEADVLYGVTMQESGVSRLVSVKLEDTKQLVQS